MKKIVATDNAPQAIGPYSQAIQYGDFLFVSGQIAIDPKTGNIIEGDIEAQTEQVLKNISAIIAEVVHVFQKAGAFNRILKRHTGLCDDGRYVF